ncbi:MAG: hypothetical protein Q9216_002118 [Gyalolechia sp. 2 TL-2023]
MIQAKSLSSVVDLADNPPPSVHSRVEISDPLILYIARVPGSRDDDVDDERIRRSGDNSRINGSEAESQVSVDIAKGIMRKPLGSDPHHTAERQATITPSTHPHYQTPLAPSHDMGQIARKPVKNNVQPEVDVPYSSSKPPKGRILGPRAMHARLHSDDSVGLGTSRGKENIVPRRWSEQPSVQQPSSSSEQNTRRGSPGLMGNTQDYDPRNDLSLKHSPLNQEAVLSAHSEHQRRSADCENAGLSLTLIRRYDGNQWNVGKISSVYDPGSVWENHSTTRKNDLSILISSPGYSRFRTPDASGASVTADCAFERRLTRLQRRSQGSGLSEDSPNIKDNRKQRMSLDFRRLSKPRLDTTSQKRTESAKSSDNKSTGVKGYGFYSPWNGSCEFTSGISGHALKCKHTAPMNGSQAVTVSEIRFNLPTSTGTNGATPRDLKASPRSKDVKRSSYFSNEHGSEPHDTILEPNRNDDKSDHLGLSLGQEHAGGGFGGKKAKLGKLIIEPEGLKMLDLLVAANMGLWWKVYEKSA